MKDVYLAFPSVGQFLGYNGSEWINATIPVGEGGAGVTLYLDGVVIVPGPTNPTTLFQLVKSPNILLPETLQSVTTTASNTAVLFELYIFSSLNVSTIPGGDWTFEFSNSVDTLSGGTISRMIFNINKVLVGSWNSNNNRLWNYKNCYGNRIYSFIPSDASAIVGYSGYLQTPTGVFPISGYTSSSIVDITVPISYTGEINVSFYVHRQLFQAVSDKITTTSPTSQQTKTTQPAFSVSTTDMLSLATFGTNITADTRIISYIKTDQHVIHNFILLFLHIIMIYWDFKVELQTNITIYQHPNLL